MRGKPITYALIGAACAALAVVALQRPASDAAGEGATVVVQDLPERNLRQSSPEEKSPYHPTPRSAEEERYRHIDDHHVPADVLVKVRAAAELGDATSMGMLGEFYHEGSGDLERDLRKAFYWFRKGSDAGDLVSKLYLGKYYRGEFPELAISKDLDMAEQYLLEVAKTGNPNGMSNLAVVLYEKARNGQPERREEAHWWYNRATGGKWDPDYVPPSLRDAAQENTASD